MAKFEFEVVDDFSPEITFKRPNYYRKYFITFNPNCNISATDPDFPAFRRFFEYKTKNLFFTQKHIQSCIDYKERKNQTLSLDDIDINLTLSFETGDKQKKHHFHAVLLLKAPYDKTQHLGISFKRIHEIARKVYTEQEVCTYHLDIKNMDATAEYVRDYMHKTNNYTRNRKERARPENKITNNNKRSNSI